MKFVRVYTGDDNESHVEVIEPVFSDRDGTRTTVEVANAVSFAHRPRPHRLRTPPTAQASEVDLPQPLEAVGGASAGECS